MIVGVLRLNVQNSWYRRRENDLIFALYNNIIDFTVFMSC